MAELKNTCILHEINIKFGESGLFKNEPVMTLVFRSVCKEHNALIYNTFNIPYNSYSVSQCAPFREKHCNRSQCSQAGVLRCLQTAPWPLRPSSALIGTSGLEGPGRLCDCETRP